MFNFNYFNAIILKPRKNFLKKFKEILQKNFMRIFQYYEVLDFSKNSPLTASGEMIRNWPKIMKLSLQLTLIENNYNISWNEIILFNLKTIYRGVELKSENRFKNSPLNCFTYLEDQWEIYFSKIISITIFKIKVNFSILLIFVFDKI